MARETVQSIMLAEIRTINTKLDALIPTVEGLKVKAAVAGGVAGMVGTGIVAILLSAFKLVH